MKIIGKKKAGVLKIIGLGCGGCLVSAFVIAALVIGIGGIVFQMMKNSDPYKEALVHARKHPEVVAAVGEPIETGLMVLGSIETTGPSGEASMSFPISGPIGKAKVFVEAQKSAGKWEISVLQVEIKETGRRIDLLE